MLEPDSPEDCHNGVKDKDNEKEKTTQIKKTKTTPMKMTETKTMKMTNFLKGVGVMYAMEDCQKGVKDKDMKTTKTKKMRMTK